MSDEKKAKGHEHNQGPQDHQRNQKTAQSHDAASSAEPPSEVPPLPDWASA